MDTHLGYTAAHSPPDTQLKTLMTVMILKSQLRRRIDSDGDLESFQMSPTENPNPDRARRGAAPAAAFTPAPALAYARTLAATRRGNAGDDGGHSTRQPASINSCSDTGAVRRHSIVLLCSWEGLDTLDTLCIPLSFGYSGYTSPT